MRPFAPLLAILSLAATSTRALLQLPEGYNITKVYPIREDDQYPNARGNPYTPLLDVTLKCSKKPNGKLIHYSLTGTNWYGVDEKDIKSTINTVYRLKKSKWNYWSWNQEQCTRNSEGVKECIPGPGWSANFNLHPEAKSEVIMLELHKLTGTVAKKGKEEDVYDFTKFEISNGTHTRMSSVAEAFPGPPPGLMFSLECGWM